TVHIFHYLHPSPKTMNISQQICDYIINNNLLTVSQLYNNIKNNEIEENNPSFKLLYQDQHSLAFLTSLLFILPNKVTKTIIVNSTYGTNCLKFELFAVLGVLDSARFLLSYFFLEPKYPYSKTHAITMWFKSLEENGIQNVENILTDKDCRQIM
ncbi:20024_t:CDS:2, partial [Racocetra persica]